MARGRAVGEALQAALARDPFGQLALPIEVRGRLLYNPDLESSHFFVPGLIGIILQVVLLFLTSFSIVREREQGTLEQLFVTPVGRAGLMFGKLLPYALMAFGELLIVLVMMVAVFGVPIHGSLLLLLALSTLFIVTALGLGLLISTVAKSQLQSMQFAMMIMLPSVLLSGFMFPRSEMPLPIYLVSSILPVTYFVEILRGVILRRADAADLWPHIAGRLLPDPCPEPQPLPNGLLTGPGTSAVRPSDVRR
jgi:ABC transporter DrrB family efflux protein